MLYFIKYKPVNNLTHAGTGKTVIAAFDYRNFRKKHPGEACRLLFVAHREEILTQSWDTSTGNIEASVYILSEMYQLRRKCDDNLLIAFPSCSI